MIAPLCVCALAPRWPNRVRVVIVQDRHERHKTTNTGRLVPLALANCALVAASDASVELLHGARSFLLFPGTEAPSLTSFLGTEARSLVLVVADGNWPRARRLAGHHPVLRALPRVALPTGPESQFLLRHAPRPDHLATLEAVARALGVLEGPAVEQALDQWFRVFVDRTRWSRGELTASEVTGGIPEAAFSFRGTRRPPPRDRPDSTGSGVSVGAG